MLIKAFIQIEHILGLTSPTPRIQNIIIEARTNANVILPHNYHLL